MDAAPDDVRRKRLVELDRGGAIFGVAGTYHVAGRLDEETSSPAGPLRDRRRLDTDRDLAVGSLLRAAGHAEPLFVGETVHGLGCARRR